MPTHQRPGADQLAHRGRPAARQGGQLRCRATALPQRSPLPGRADLRRTLAFPRARCPLNAFVRPAAAARGGRQAVGGGGLALQAPVQEPLRASGTEPLGSTPQQLAEAVEAASTAWATFVRDYGIAQE